MDRGAWQAAVHEVTKSWTQLSDFHFYFWASLVAQLVKNPLAIWETWVRRETWVRSLGWEDSPGEGNGNPLHYSCLKKSMDKGAWQATVHGFAKGQT